MSEPIYLIYRNRETTTIKKYSVIKVIPPDLDHHISKFNKENKDLTVEKTDDIDFITLINLAENNSKIKGSDLKDIEYSIERLQEEIYNLKERI
jgi:hypothetical protein